ncbi:WXG100-like domain-containing protein [Mycolicibacterium sphagni]|uniref:WXG100-like domain-containing protein n=2 Tax=Mycolicibacterium sphagni TaxID=1786 RepID=UPI0021F30705|nr:hypothetical protein [Mycolicibacterium sphagni]MCV7178535.1 hypothetical protein [Mycolicibacterium sphagni]
MWYLVEFLVGDWWPNGEPSELRAAGAAWNAFATPLYGITGENAGAYAVIDAQQMPDKEPMKAAVRDVGTAMSSLAGEAQKLGSELSHFASDVENTQNAIRDLLNKLKSVVGSISDNGILGTVFELVTGDAEEKIQEVANDIKAVIANHKRQSAARKELLSDLVNGIKNYSRAMEIVLRVELVNYLGEDAGRIAANIADQMTDTSVGLTLGAVNTVGGLVTSFDPIGDPKGTLATIEGLGKMAEVFNPMTAPLAFATDPQGSIDMVKNVTHFNDIFTSNRPFIGVGELGFDIGTAVVPGGAAAKAGSGARVAEEAAARAEITTTERAAGEAGGIASATTGLRGVSRDLEGVTSKLDDLNKTTLDGGKPPSGSPGPLPKTPEPPPAPREPVPSGAPGKPTSAPTSGDHLPPPVTHTPHTEPAPTGEGAPGRVPGAAEAPAAPASSAGRPPVSDPIAEAPAAAAGASPGGSGLPNVPSAGSMGGEAAHAPSGMPSGIGDAGDRVPVSVGAHGAEGAGGGAGHGPHPGGGGGDGGGGGGSHGGSGDHGGGGGGHGHGHGDHGDGNGHGDGDRDDSHDGPHDSDASDPPGISPEKRDEILAMEKGDRPDPSEYLSPEFIQHHLEKFDDGAARFMPLHNFEKYGLAQVDGTAFVMPKGEADSLSQLFVSDPSGLERALGLPEGFFDRRKLVRIDVPHAEEFGLRIPSGNEAGANEYWVPGGFLPDGSSEAVIDGARIPSDRYDVTVISKNSEG